MQEDVPNIKQNVGSANTVRNHIINYGTIASNKKV
jgi:hypothetical protein